MRENTFFFKGIRDALKLRRQISECFERASLPHTTNEVPSPSLSGPGQAPECASAGAYSRYWHHLCADARPCGTTQLQWYGGAHWLVSCGARQNAQNVAEVGNRSSPGCGMQERQKLLSFVIVGGGPTGVEVAAELHDMIRVWRQSGHTRLS